MLCAYCQDNLCPLLMNRKLALGQFPSSTITSTEDGNLLSTKKTQITTWARDGCPIGTFLLENVIGDHVSSLQTSPLSDIQDLKKQIHGQRRHGRTNPFSNTAWNEGQLDADSPEAGTNADDVVVLVKTFRGLIRGEVYRITFYLEDKNEITMYNVKPHLQLERVLTQRDFLTEVFTDSDDPLSPYIFGRPASKELGSKENLDLARSWITRCTKGAHRSCPSAIEYEYPLRLLDVCPDGLDSSDIVRLHLSNPDQRGHYLTLSYCWGFSQNFITTAANLTSMLCGISLKSMPKTFRDAIYLTREFGYRYIWIDALCIIQDSDIDKVEQVSRMQDIYRNATFTISASRSADCHDGFLGSVHLDTENSPEVVSGKIPYSSPEGVVGSIQLRKLVGYTTSLQPIHKRCWTYQEHFLSRRVLSFGDQMSWRCASGEDLNFGFLGEETSPFGIPKSDPSTYEDLMWDLITFRIEEFYEAGRDSVSGEHEDALSGNTSDTLMRDAKSEPVNDITKDTTRHIVKDDSSKTSKTSDRSGGLLAGHFQEMTKDSVIKSFFAIKENCCEIQRAVARRDLLALIQSINLLLVRACELEMDHPKVVEKSQEMNTALRAAIDRNDGLGILQLMVHAALDSLLDDPEMHPVLEESGIQLPIVADAEHIDVLDLIPKLMAMIQEPEVFIDLKDEAESHWPVVVEQYSQRLLSDPNDRLPALSGIATEFSGLVQEEYLAGLWENNLVHGLMWQQENQYLSRGWTPLNLVSERQGHPPKKLPYTAPSWSWAAVEGAIHYPKLKGEISKGVEILEHDITLAVPGQLFGKITGGFLKIRAPMRKVHKTWFTTGLIGRKETNPDANSKLAYLLEIDPDPWDLTPHYFWLLELFRKPDGFIWYTHTSQGLVLEEAKDGVFRRAGVYKLVCGSISNWLSEQNYRIRTVDII